MKRFFLILCFVFSYPAICASLEEDYKELLPEIEFLNIQTGANIKILEPYIEKGNSVAMYLLAQMYETGDVIEKNEQKAFELYLKSAQKNPDAQFAVANMYLKGKGTEVSREKALQYYQMLLNVDDVFLKSQAQIKIKELKNIQEKENKLNEMEVRALNAEPISMIELAEFCLTEKKLICSYVWLSLCRQMPEFEKSYSDLDKAILELTGTMTMRELTQAEEEISKLQIIFKK